MKATSNNKIISIIIFVLLTTTGCSVWREYKRDYLNADQSKPGEWKAAWKTYKNDYLRANEWNENTLSDAWKSFKNDYLETNKNKKDMTDLERIYNAPKTEHLDVL